MTKKIDVQPVVMAGGSGTRLWPLSRSGFPKQFLVLSGDTSLFQQAVPRLQGLADAGIAVAAPLVVGNEEHRFLVLDQLRELGAEPAAVLLEPVGRNTAPAVTLAALQALEGAGADADPVLVVTPADQTVTDDRRLQRRAAGGRGDGSRGRDRDPGRHARPARDRLWLHPRRRRSRGPVRREARPRDGAEVPCRRRVLLERRHVRAARLGVDGRARTLPPRHRRRLPRRLGQARQRCQVRAPGQGRVRSRAQRIGGLRGARALPWRARHPRCSRWMPVGTISAPGKRYGRWPRRTPPATRPSATRSSATAATRWCTPPAGWSAWSACTTWSWSRRPTPCWWPSREKSQDVKNIVNQLGREQRGEHALHRKVHRPWGWYDSIDNGPRHQVKRILVKPGASLEPADAPPPRRTLDRGQRHRRGDRRRQGHPAEREPEHLHPAGPDAPAARTRARCRWRSSRCSRAATWARTTSCALKTPTADHDHPRHRRRRLHRQQFRARLARAVPTSRSSTSTR